MTGLSPDARLSVTAEPPAGARDTISSLLGAFNIERTGQADWRTLAVLLQAPDEDVQGGLWGVTSYGWLSIELVFVPPDLRGSGLGARMLELAEAEARARGCAHAWLDTFEFQARGFYERHGYSCFAALQDYPPGQQRFFLRKDL